jgi:hypothetical protein
MEITVTCHPWSLKITILGTKQVSRKMGAYHTQPPCKENFGSIRPRTA